MVTKSKLKLALAAEKGMDFRKLNQKKKAKTAIKEKAKKKGAKILTPEEGSEEEDEEWEDEDDEEDSRTQYDLGNLEDSDSSDSDVEMEKKIERPKKAAPSPQTSKKERRKAPKKAEEDDDDEEEEAEDDEEEDIAMSDLEDLPDEEKDDLIRHQRLTINNTTALLASLRRISLAKDSSVPFSTHMCVVSSNPTEADIEDVADDLNRELALYKQSLEAAKKARSLLKAEGVPFSRPGDYFAEMIKADDHMEKVKAKLVEDATAKKAAAEARKLRDLKKFGKQVQVAKIQERAKAKRDTLEKISSLKRKRQESTAELPAREADLFDVAVDDELKSHSKSSGGFKGGRGGAAGGERNQKRQKKDGKYGFGGKKKFSKSNDGTSSGDLSGFNLNRMRGKPGGGGGGSKPRLGKSKRKAAAGRK